MAPANRTRQTQTPRRVQRPPSLGAIHRSQQSVRSSSNLSRTNNHSINSTSNTPTNLSKYPPINGISAIKQNQRYPPNQQQAINQIRQPPPLTSSQRLQVLLDGRPHHLDQPGPQSRVVLSIKSGIGSEVDFGLEVLLAASYYEPELVQVSKFPGLLEPLLELISDYSSPGPFEDRDEQSNRRRALEAASILRNLVSLEYNTPLITASPSTLSTLVEGLQLCQDDSDPELVGLLLDILESVAAQGVKLNQSLPRRPGGKIINFSRHLKPTLNLSSEGTQTGPVKDGSPEVDTSWSTVLINRLDQLTDSPDRSIVLGAYRCLAAFGLLPMNQVTIATLLLQKNKQKGINPKQPWPRSIERALVLLALPDVELLLSILDYLYAITSTSSLALAICYHHPEIISIFRLLLVHTRHLRKVEHAPIQTLPLPSQEWYFQRPPPPPAQAVMERVDKDSSPTATLPGNCNTPQTATMTEVNRILLSESQLGGLIELKEPQRAHRWMARVFEPWPDAEVQQVTLWLAYKTQFEPYQQRPGGVTMIAPADAIKLTSEVFPTASPSVTERPNGEKRFVIKGMRVREKIKNPEIYYCRWKNCEDPKSAASEGPEALYRHILRSHLKDQVELCGWHTCGHKSTSDQLKYHIRTHIAPRPIPTKTQPQAQTQTMTKPEGPAKPLIFRTYRHEFWRTPNGGESNLGAIGIGYVAFLVLRNLIRSISESIQELERLSAESSRLREKNERDLVMSCSDGSGIRMGGRIGSNGVEGSNSEEFLTTSSSFNSKKRGRRGQDDDDDDDDEGKDEKGEENYGYDYEGEGWGTVEIEETKQQRDEEIEGSKKENKKKKENLEERIERIGVQVKTIEPEVLSWACKDFNVLGISMEVLGLIDCIDRIKKTKQKQKQKDEINK